MKTILLAAAAAALTVAAQAAESVVLEGGKTDVVIEKGAPPAVKFAAKELSGFLSRVFGSNVPVANEPKEGRTALILGVNGWSKAAGIDPDQKPRDTYFIKTAPGRVYLAGRDDKRRDPATTSSSLESFERATSFAVYGFLERFAGCRFYFPGELGEIVPKAERIEVPPTDIASTPSFLVRKYYNHSADGKWYDDGPHAKDGKRLNWLRLKMATTVVPCCHGTSYMKFREKFAETHPEFFALRSDGSRYTNYTGTKSSSRGHLCFSHPGLRQAMFEECVARFAKGAEYVDIMPNDSYPECKCAGCQAVYRLSDKRNYASELIWDFTVDIANRLKKAGIKGKVTQMAYSPYRRIPDIEIPDNVEVMVAETGPFSMANPKELKRQFGEIRAWSKKIGRPVWIWTYPHKYGTTMIPGLPDVTPRVCGEYYKQISDVIFGTFAETETDKWIYHYLNYYVMSRVFWDASVDVGAVLDEHHRLMFGAGAREMAEFYDILEDRWVRGIAGNIKDTAIGPVATAPTERDIWTRIYTPEIIGRLDSLLNAAAAKVAEGSMEARRIAFIREQYFDPLAAAPQRWRKHVAEVDAYRWNIPSGSEISLRPLGPTKPKPEDEVKTTVSARRTADALVFTFDCEEPNMDDLTSSPRKHDDPDMWCDSGVEVFLNPSCDRVTLLHFIVNADGGFFDATAYKPGGGFAKGDTKWESGGNATVEKRANGWKTTITIPLAALGKDAKDSFPAEFCRSRVTKSGKGHGLYVWSPFVFRNYDDVTNYGTIETK